MLLLDFNDADVTLSRDGEVLYRAPGVAHVDEARVLFGAEAESRSRLYPGLSHDQFWRRLNAEPVSPPGPAAANQADLVYLHLKEILAAAGGDRGEDLVALAPGAITSERLSLFLGIAGEAGAAVRAVVDTGVAAGAAHAFAPDAVPLTCAVIDVSRYCGIVSTLEVDADVHRRAVVEVVEAGTNGLFEGWIALVADRFVGETRLDPLQIAATEQQLFDRLAALVADGEGTRFELSHDDGIRRVDVAPDALARKASRSYDALARAADGADAVLLTHRAAGMPGLEAHLKRAGCAVAALAEQDLREAVAAGMPRITADGAAVRFITSLDARHAADPAAPAVPAAAEAPAPTHLLCGDIAAALSQCADASDHPACPLSGPAIEVGTDGGAVRVTPAARGVTLNGEPLTAAAAVSTGDRMAWQGIEFRLIAVA